MGKERIMLNGKNTDKWNSLRFGLVLSGGGAKGAYEAGAIKAMNEMDVSEKVYGVSGTSVGALNTLVFAMDNVSLMESLWENIGLMTVAAPKAMDGDSRAIKDIVGRLHITAQLQGGGEGAVFTQNSLRALIRNSCDFERIRAHRAKLFACAYDINERHVKYFELKKLSDDDMTDAVLASAAIPRVYDPVEIEGHKFADGGINDPAYGIKNSDVTPLSPLQDEGYDIILVIHLREQESLDIDHIGSTRLIHIYPSKPLEQIKGSGTMNFTRSAIRERFNMGYADMYIALGKLLMSIVKE